MVTDVCKAAGGAHDEVTSFLNAEVAQILFGGHVEAGFKLSEKATERKIGGIGQCADGDVFAEVFVEKIECGAKFLVFAEGGSALNKGTSHPDDSANDPCLIVERLLGGC